MTPRSQSATSSAPRRSTTSASGWSKPSANSGHAPGAAVLVQLDPDHTPPVPVREVLAPERDEDVSAVFVRKGATRIEGDAVRGRAGLEICDGRRYPGAAADEPPPPVTRPAARPAVERAALHHDHGLRRLGPRRRPELVLTIDRDVEPVAPGLQGEPERVSQPARFDAQVAPVAPNREDRRAAPVALAADVARRPGAEPQAAVGPQDDVVLLVAPEGQAPNEDPPRREPSPAQDEPLEPALLRDEQGAPSQTRPSGVP
jgi:hypothetical protein